MQYHAGYTLHLHIYSLAFFNPFYTTPHTKQYTHIIELMDAGELPLFNHIIPPPIAMSYWKLGTILGGWGGGARWWIERERVTHKYEGLRRIKSIHLHDPHLHTHAHTYIMTQNVGRASHSYFYTKPHMHPQAPTPPSVTCSWLSVRTRPRTGK